MKTFEITSSPIVAICLLLNPMVSCPRVPEPGSTAGPPCASAISARAFPPRRARPRIPPGTARPNWPGRTRRQNKKARDETRAPCLTGLRLPGRGQEPVGVAGLVDVEADELAEVVDAVDHGRADPIRFVDRDPLRVVQRVREHEAVRGALGVDVRAHDLILVVHAERHRAAR